MIDGVEWIDEPAGLLRLCAGIDAGPLAFDSEADSMHHYRDKVCLLQLSFAGRDVIVDPLSGIDLAPLKRPLEDPSILKIVHGGDYDVRILHRDHGLSPRGLFDTMIAARLTGERSFGLASLLEKHLSVRLDKALQRADWSRRPLPAAMVAYAAEDTRHLSALAIILEERLASLGRASWAAEEFARLEGVRWSQAEDADPDAYRRVKGAGALDPRGLAVIRELVAWREERARLLDRPLFRILRDDLLVAVAAHRPLDRTALGAIDGIGPRLAGGGAGPGLLEAVARGLEVREDELPPPFDRRRPAPDAAFEARVARLKRRRDEAAHALGLEGPVLGGRGVLEAIQRAIDSGDDPARLPEVRAWQWSLLRGSASS